MLRSLALALLAASPLAQAAPAPVLPAGIEAHPNLTYARNGDRELQLDLYRPAVRSVPLPAIVCIHGGGWWKGERSNHAALAQALAAKGFVTVTISYRLSGEKPFPAQIHDAKAAVRWLRAHADRYGLDPARIGATGHSAGGHLTALLATSGGVDALEGEGGEPGRSSRIQAAVAMGAQSDFDTPHVRANEGDPAKLPMWVQFLGGSFADVPERYRAASPAHYLDAQDPPLAFITGETDHPSTQADGVRRRLIGLGIPTGLTVIKGAGHGIFQRPEWSRQVVDSIAAFFALHLTHLGRPPVETTLAAPPFAPGARWTMIGGGYAGSEGAQWIGDTLHFAAHHDRFAFTWTERAGLAVWRDDSPEATSFRPDGRGGFYVVEQTTRRLTRWDAAGKMTEILADKFEAKRLNRPNDCIVRSDGTVWFTDPDFLFAQRKTDVKELTEQNVYRYDPRTRALTAAARGFDKPNGLAFSPDEKTLFVTDSAGFDILRFAVAADGTLGSREIFATLKVKGLDGLAFDPAGRLWCAALDGVHIFDSTGRDLGVIALPSKPTAIAFAPTPSRLVCVTTRDAAFITTLR